MCICLLSLPLGYWWNKETRKKETEAFFASLSTCKTKPAILFLVELYASNYIPKSLDENLPICLPRLYKPENPFMNYGELLKVCETCDISISQQQAKAVELNTKSQSMWPLWFDIRTGRITASHFKAASHTAEGGCCHSCRLRRGVITNSR